MKFLNAFLAMALLSSAPAFAGFQGVSGTTSLGIFNKIKCSTGLTCTKVLDSFQMVSSPTVAGGSVTITGANDNDDAYLLLNADRGDDNPDFWKIMSKASDDILYFQNKTSGAYVTKMSVDTSGNTAIAGTLAVTGAFTPTGGIAASATTKTIFGSWSPGVATNATNATPSATVVYLTQLWVPHNVTLTGVGVLNGTVAGGTNKYIVALFDSAGTVLANSSTAGVSTSGTSAFQKVPFTGTYSLVGPRTVWVGIYMNGTTDRYYAIPSIGQMSGLAGSVSAQTFGTVANVTLPTTFTADVGPVVYVY